MMTYVLIIRPILNRHHDDQIACSCETKTLKLLPSRLLFLEARKRRKYLPKRHEIDSNRIIIIRPMVA